MATKPRVKTGIKGIPLDRGFRAVDYYMHYDLEKKDLVKLAKQYVKNNYSKEDAKAINANAEWNLYTMVLLLHLFAWIMVLNSLKNTQDILKRW
jgi:hypothetical protein